MRYAVNKSAAIQAFNTFIKSRYIYGRTLNKLYVTCDHKCRYKFRIYYPAFLRIYERLIFIQLPVYAKITPECKSSCYLSAGWPHQPQYSFIDASYDGDFDMRFALCGNTPLGFEPNFHGP